MSLFKKSIFICMQNYRKWRTNYRIWVLFLLVTFFISTYTSEIVKFSKIVGYPTSPWFFPFLFSQKYIKVILFLGIVLLFCDAPFIDESQPYVIARSGRKSFCIGQILYICSSTVLYFVSLLVISIIINLPHMEYNSDWGKVLGTLGVGGGGDQVSYKIFISGKIVTFFTPFQAVFYTLLLSILAGIFIGLFIYVANVLLNSRVLGTSVGVFFILFDTLIRRNMDWLKLSPISWSSLDLIDIDGTSRMPSIHYVLSMYTVMILVLMAIGIITSRKQAIEVQASI